GELSGRWGQLLGVGLQQPLPVGALRLGLSSNLEDGSILGGGLTLGPVDLGLARFQNGDVGDSSRRGWIASFGLSVRVQ
ncbi:MAG TPA: hypothetical protein VHG28_01815, partial [Longimicrobiaceae bacterium]|nr:hypothetical protein [Longimicrobiaceae bacterium]